MPLTSGAGAVIGECVAEALIDRELLMKEALQESQIKGKSFDEKAFKSTYEEKLKPYISASRLIAGSVIAATGRDPSMAIAAATNALENNFAGTPYPELMDPDVAEALPIASEAIVEVMEDIRKNPKEYAEEVVIGAIPYADIVRRVAHGEEVSPIEFGIETGLTFIPIGKIVNAGAKTGGKILGKFSAAVAKKMDTQKLLKARGTPNAGGTITSFVTKQEEVYYRVYSGKNKSGAYFTKTHPKNALYAQEGLALPASNTAEYIQEVIIPTGVRLQRSRALPVPKWGRYRGGMEQFQVLNLDDLSKLIFKDGVPFK